MDFTLINFIESLTSLRHWQPILILVSLFSILKGVVIVLAALSAKAERLSYVRAVLLFFIGYFSIVGVCIVTTGYGHVFVFTSLKLLLLLLFDIVIYCVVATLLLKHCKIFEYKNRIRFYWLGIFLNVIISLVCLLWFIISLPPISIMSVT